MTAATATQSGAKAGAPPVPHEHGAWMMLYAPLVTGLLAYGVDPGPAVLLVVAATAAFFAQNAAGLLLRGRAAPWTALWLALDGAAGLAAVAGLTLGYGLWPLLVLAAPGVALFAWQAQRRHATRRQVDRATANELATVAVLSLGAAAAHVAATEALTPAAVAPWAAFALYFGGSVYYVKMRVEAARLRDGRTWARRWRAGWRSSLCHLGLGLLAGAGIAAGGPTRDAAALAAAAVAPAVGRALWAGLRLTDAPPRLRRLGVWEIVYAVWFSGWIGAALAAVPAHP